MTPFLPPSAATKPRRLASLIAVLLAGGLLHSAHAANSSSSSSSSTSTASAKPASKQPTKPTAAPAKPASSDNVASAPAALPRLLNLAEGKSSLLHLPFAAARIAVGDAQVADVILINPNEVYLLGKSSGATNLVVWNHNNQAVIVDIAVGIDAVGLRNQFDELFPNEKQIHITASGGSVILTGVVADAVKASQVVAVASAFLQHSAAAPAATGAAAAAPAASSAAAAAPAATSAGKVINMLGVAAPQQVMLEVKIAEVSKTLIDQLGASLGINVKIGNWSHALVSSLLTDNPNGFSSANNKGTAGLSVDAQKTDGLVKILAEPNIMAISGQEASFLAGGKIFIPVSQTNNNGTPTITLEEKEYGVAVKFTPTVLENGRINLKVSPEVSELNKEGIGISLTGTTSTAILPAFTTRRASTTVQLFDGQSFAIGGLIKNNVTATIKAFPGLGEVPILGALFRSNDYQSDRTELVFIVTPRLAKPLGAPPVLPTDGYTEPTRAEFFLRGKMEGRAPGAKPADGVMSVPMSGAIPPSGAATSPAPASDATPDQLK